MRISIIAVLLGCSGLVACGGTNGSRSPSDDGKLQVVAGFYPLAEAASRIGGESVQVFNLTPAGSEAHDLELTSDQVDAVLDADLVVMLGSGFQPALEAAVEQRDGPTLDLLAHLEAGPEPPLGQDDHAHGDEHGEEQGHEGDPHVWLDPKKFAHLATEISESLAELRPGDTQLPHRTADYAAELRALDVDFEKGLDRCQRRDIVTTHAAFGHLAAAYGLRQEAISGLSPESEPDPNRLAELTDHLRETGAAVIFIEPLAPADAAQALARETRLPTLILDPIEGLTPAQREAGENYQSVMRSNLRALREGLGCE